MGSIKGQSRGCAACDMQGVRQEDLHLSTNLELYKSFPGINLDVKVNSRVDWAHYVFVHALSTEISLHFKTVPLPCLTKYGRPSEMIFMPKTSLVIRSKSLNFYALICPFLGNESQLSWVLFLLERPLGRDCTNVFFQKGTNNLKTWEGHKTDVSNRSESFHPVEGTHVT